MHFFLWINRLRVELCELYKSNADKCKQNVINKMKERRHDLSFIKLMNETMPIDVNNESKSLLFSLSESCAMFQYNWKSSATFCLFYVKLITAGYINSIEYVNDRSKFVEDWKMNRLKKNWVIYEFLLFILISVVTYNMFC